MNLNTVIQQLRTYCPTLAGRVGGAADFDTGVETVVAMTNPSTGVLAYPSAVVIPLDDDTEGNDLMIGLSQQVTETIGVVVTFDATADRRGQAPVTQVEAMKYELFRALLNFRIQDDRTSLGIFYAGGSLLMFDRARLFWEFRFSHRILITDADGFPTYGDPLEEITSTVPVPVPLPDPPQDPAIPIVFSLEVGP